MLKNDVSVHIILGSKILIQIMFYVRAHVVEFPPLLVKGCIMISKYHIQLGVILAAQQNNYDIERVLNKGTIK